MRKISRHIYTSVGIDQHNHNPIIYCSKSGSLKNLLTFIAHLTYQRTNPYGQLIWFKIIILFIYLGKTDSKCYKNAEHLRFFCYYLFIELSDAGASLLPTAQ